MLTGAGAGVLLFTPSGASADTATATAPAATPAAPQGDHEGWMTDTLSKLVTDGTITQAQADAVASALQAARPQRGPGGPGGRGFGNPQVVADALGITPEQLRTELEAGKSLADVAAAHGVAEQTLIDAIVNDHKTHLAADVAAGRLTQAEADQRLADLASHVKDMVEHARPVAPAQPQTAA
jgi:hypothetical protein